MSAKNFTLSTVIGLKPSAQRKTELNWTQLDWIV